ncbi:MAG: hypothetical protein OK456_03800 [Thaumarchaeota archaeon]|nr:hypothetical protein [Nitrososphaerota archaeon]
MQFSIFDRIYWLRAGLGLVTGLAVDFLFGKDYTSGLLFGAVVFMASYYLVKARWGSKVTPAEVKKLYYTSIGSYVMIFLFVWILAFTVQLNSLNL